MVDHHRMFYSWFDAMAGTVQRAEFEQREQPNNLEYGLPYIFDFVELTAYHFKIQDATCSRCWTFVDRMNPLGPGRAILEGWGMLPPETVDNNPGAYYALYETNEGRRVQYAVDQPILEAFSMLVHEYLQPGTQIGTLKIDLNQNIPSGVNVENLFPGIEAGLKLKVRNFIIVSPTRELFNEWIATIDLDNGRHFDSIQFSVADDTMFMFHEAAVLTAKKLILTEKKIVASMRDSWVYNLPNKHVENIHKIYTFETLAVIPKVRFENRRELGTTFTQILLYATTFGQFAEYLQKNVKVIPSKFASVDGNGRQCLSFPIDEQLELVIFEEKRSEDDGDSYFARFEIMKTGTTVPKTE